MSTPAFKIAYGNAGCVGTIAFGSGAVINGLCDGCSAGVVEMYQPYIDGKKELSEISREFSDRYEQ